ncbi:hypothetical protein QT972_32345 [Microcoleus sp. herbarium7]|uniref:hypothetical protein n=1 Tax=Microcoleus sp. herbarium7 TaxID=3055435 RepID=UPI002FD66F80
MWEFAIAPSPFTAALSSTLFTGAIALFVCIFCGILAFNLNNSPPPILAAFFCRVDKGYVTHRPRDNIRSRHHQIAALRMRPCSLQFLLSSKQLAPISLRKNSGFIEKNPGNGI